MHAIRKFERVEGATLTIDVPEEFRGRAVEILVLVVDSAEAAGSIPPERDLRCVPFLLPKPPLNENSRKVMERQAAGISDPAFRFDEPFAPVVSEEDFDLGFPGATQAS